MPFGNIMLMNLAFPRIFIQAWTIPTSDICSLFEIDKLGVSGIYIVKVGKDGDLYLGIS